MTSLFWGINQTFTDSVGCTFTAAEIEGAVLRFDLGVDFAADQILSVADADITRQVANQELIFSASIPGATLAGALVQEGNHDLCWQLRVVLDGETDEKVYQGTAKVYPAFSNFTAPPPSPPLVYLTTTSAEFTGLLADVAAINAEIDQKLGTSTTGRITHSPTRSGPVFFGQPTIDVTDLPLAFLDWGPFGSNAEAPQPEHVTALVVNFYSWLRNGGDRGEIAFGQFEGNVADPAIRNKTGGTVRFGFQTDNANSRRTRFYIQTSDSDDPLTPEVEGVPRRFNFWETGLFSIGLGTIESDNGPPYARQGIALGENVIFIPGSVASAANLPAATTFESAIFWQSDQSKHVYSDGSAWRDLGSGGGSGAAKYEQTFTDTDLTVADLLPVTHNLGSYPAGVMVYDSSGEELYPDAIAYTSLNALAINLESFRPFTGTGRVQIV